MAIALASCAAAVAAPAPRVALRDRALQPGEAVLVVVTGQKPGVAPRGAFDRQPLEFFPGASSGTYLALSGIDLDAAVGPAQASVLVTAADGRSSTWTRTVAIKPKRFRVRRVNVAPDFVTPSPAQQRRAQKEAALIKSLFAQLTPRRFFLGDFSSPIPGAVVSRFGERSIFNGVPKAPHSGADLHAREGAPIKAPAGGEVVLARNLYYCGNTVMLDHGWGVHTVYCHLSRIDVREGQTVAAGEVLGLVGHTGRASGPHLHWGLKIGDDRIDPFSLASLDMSPWLR